MAEKKQTRTRTGEHTPSLTRTSRATSQVTQPDRSFEVLVGLDIGDRRFEPGEIADIPARSVEWLLAQGTIRPAHGRAKPAEPEPEPEPEPEVPAEAEPETKDGEE
jgi:hypothetical protein